MVPIRAPLKDPIDLLPAENIKAPLRPRGLFLHLAVPWTRALHAAGRFVFDKLG